MRAVTLTIKHGSSAALSTRRSWRAKTQLPIFPLPNSLWPAFLITAIKDLETVSTSAVQKNSGTTIRLPAEPTSAKIPTSLKVRTASARFMPDAFFIFSMRICFANALSVFFILLRLDILSIHKKIQRAIATMPTVIRRACATSKRVCMTNLSVSAGDTHGRFLAGLDLPIYPKPSKMVGHFGKWGRPQTDCFQVVPYLYSGTHSVFYYTPISLSCQVLTLLKGSLNSIVRV